MFFDRNKRALIIRALMVRWRLWFHCLLVRRLLVSRYLFSAIYSSTRTDSCHHANIKNNNHCQDNKMNAIIMVIKNSFNTWKCLYSIPLCLATLPLLLVITDCFKHFDTKYETGYYYFILNFMDYKILCFPKNSGGPHLIKKF